MNAGTEVLIIGGGVVGVSAAYYAAAAGADVLLLEAGEIGAAATTASAGLLVPSYLDPLPSLTNLLEGVRSFVDPQSALRIPPRAGLHYFNWLARFIKAGLSPALCRRSMEIILRLQREGALVNQELVALGGADFHYRHQGLLYVCLTEPFFQAARKAADHLASYQVALRLLNREETREMDPSLSPRVAGGLFFPDDGQVDPAALMAWLAARCRDRGVRFATGTEVYGFQRDRRRALAALTTRGEFVADQFVLATGAWLGQSTGMLGRRVPMEGAKGYNLTFPLSAGSPRATMILEEKRIAVSPYSDRLCLTSGLEMDGLNVDISASRVARIPAMANLYFPDLVLGPPTAVRRGLRPCSADGLPVVGRLPGMDNVLVAGGHDQKGLTLGPLAGRQIADLLSGRSLGDLEKELSPERFW